jgi:hypothetical protein
LNFSAFSQVEDYQFQRKIENADEGWQKIVLPVEIFQYIKEDFSDLRIFEVSEKDTLEVPYLLENSKGKQTTKNIGFEVLNKTSKNEEYFFTFKILENQTINEIKLNFENKNFDWKTKLEGSQSLDNWKQIVENYRLVRLENELEIYNFSTLIFTDSNFEYYRLSFKSEEIPKLLSATIRETRTQQTIYQKHAIQLAEIESEDQDKKSVYELQLKQPVPISILKLNFEEENYYRDIHVEYLKDSTETTKGWHKNYYPLLRTSIFSKKENEFSFETKTTSSLLVTIQNEDNPPIALTSAEVKSYIFEIKANLKKDKHYILVYGNSQVKTPNYDLEKFKNTIPTIPTKTNLGNEQLIKKPAKQVAEPLFKNSIWLWAVLILIVVFLGFFTFKMLQKK